MSPSEIHIWHCGVADADARTDCLVEGEIEQSSRFVFEKDRRRYLITRRMLREVLSQYATIPPKEWTFVANEFGKPRIEPTQWSGLYFNISHTSDLVVCAVASTPEIGVDIEDRIPDEYLKLAEMNFAEEEQEWLHAATRESESHRRFLAIWTLKEAYMKAVGTGMSMPLTSFSIIPTHPNGAELRQFPKDDPHHGKWVFSRFELGAGVPLAVASPHTDLRRESRFFDFQRIG